MKFAASSFILIALTFALASLYPRGDVERTTVLRIRAEPGSNVRVSNVVTDPECFDPENPYYEINPLLSFTSDGASVVRKLPPGTYQVSMRVGDSERALTRIVEVGSDQIRTINLGPYAIVSIEGRIDPSSAGFRSGLRVGLRPPFRVSNTLDLANAPSASRVAVAEDGRFLFGRVAVLAGDVLVPFVEYPNEWSESEATARLYTPIDFGEPIRIPSELSENRIQLPTTRVSCPSPILLCGVSILSSTAADPFADRSPTAIVRSGELGREIEVEP